MTTQSLSDETFHGRHKTITHRASCIPFIACRSHASEFFRSRWERYRSANCCGAWIRSWHKAGLAQATEDVRYWRWSGRGPDRLSGRLLTLSGNSRTFSITSAVLPIANHSGYIHEMNAGPMRSEDFSGSTSSPALRVTRQAAMTLGIVVVAGTRLAAVAFYLRLPVFALPQ